MATVRFVGGNLDGKLLTIHYPHHRLTFPSIQQSEWRGKDKSGLEGHYNVGAFRTLVYAHISTDPDGTLVYQFEGTR